MPDKHLFLHIGTHKTGTTSIQSFLQTNRVEMESRGFYYPADGMYYLSAESSQSLLAHAVLGRRPAYIGDVEFDLDTCVADIRRDIGKSSCPNVIVSSEHFSYASTKDDVRRILDVFTGLVGKITVIIYLRRQHALIESGWSQQIKTGLITSSLNEYLEAGRDWDYFQHVELFASALDRENVIVRPYEVGQLHKRDVVSDFLNTIGYKIHRIPGIRINESPPTEMLELMRYFGKSFSIDRERITFNRILQSLPIKIDKARYTLFSEQMRSALIDRYRNSNSRVAQEYLGRADGVLFFDSEISALPVYPGMTIERFSAISAQVITLLLNTNNQLARKIRDAESSAH